MNAGDVIGPSLVSDVSATLQTLNLIGICERGACDERDRLWFIPIMLLCCSEVTEGASKTLKPEHFLHLPPPLALHEYPVSGRTFVYVKAV